ncbi:MAG: universal stress protein [Betaproteobacteria bacterium]
MTTLTLPPVFHNPLLVSECTEFDAGAERVPLAVPLRVVFPLVSNAEYEAVAPQAAARAEHDAARGLANLRASAQAAGVDLSTDVRRGAEPDQEIIDEVSRSNADLLILPRRGKSGFLRRLLIGEIVGRLLDRAPCTVIVVPRLCDIWRRGVMVLVDDVDIDASTTVTSVGAAMARMANLPLSLLVASSVEEPAGLVALERIAAASGGALQKKRVTRTDDVLNDARAAVAAGVDLLVMRNGAPGTPAGDLMRQMMSANDVPVLAVRT